MADEMKTFETGDLYLVAALTCLLKIEPQYIIHGKKTFAQFEATDDLYRAMNAYNAGVQLPAIEYGDAIKLVRTEFIRRRQNDEGTRS